jgi:hypothetical protein
MYISKSDCVIGSKVHNGIRNDKYGSPYGAGDIIGCFLHIDDQDPVNNQMRFFKNGIDQGIAFQGLEIESGIYFPAISLYMQVLILMGIIVIIHVQYVRGRYEYLGFSDGQFWT